MGVLRLRTAIPALVAALLLALPTPAGAVAKRVFTAGQLAAMSRDWEKMAPEPFFKKYKLHRPIFTRLRKENDGLFPEKKRGILGDPQKLESLKVGYLAVVAGLRKELDVLEEHDVTYGTADELRKRPEHAADIPFTKNRETPQKPPRLDAKVISDWAQVRTGQMSPQRFRKKYPLVRAGDLAALQDWQKSRIKISSGTQGKVADAVKELTAEELEQARAVAGWVPKIPVEKLDRLRKVWPRVERGEISQAAAAAEAGIPRHHLVAYKQVHPDEFVIPEVRLTADEVQRLKARWPDIQARKVSLERVLKDEKIVKWRFYKHREDTGDFKDQVRSKFDADAAVVGGSSKVFSDATVRAARDLFARFHRAEVTQAELSTELRKLGVSWVQGIDHLRTLDQDAFSTREQFLDRNYEKIVDDLVALAHKHRYVIKRWQDFTEIAERDPALKSKWGPLRVSTQKGWIVMRDRKGDRRLHDALGEIGIQVGGVGRHRSAGKPAAPAKAEAAAEEAASVDPKLSQRQMAEAMSAALAGIKEPTREKLIEVLHRVAPREDAEATWKSWLSMRGNYEGIFKELQRWNFNDRNRRYSLRYIARYALVVHEAGPGATHEQILERFKQTDEFKEDGRLPSQEEANRVTEMIKYYPELVASRPTWVSFQRDRRMLELLRTARKGLNLYDLRPQLEEIGFGSLSTVYATLRGMDRSSAERLGYDWNTVQTIRRFKKALGQKADPHFDPSRAPPEVNLELARDILDTPHNPEMLEMALERLKTRKGGPLPFQTHHVMFINHRYSDLVPFAETMIKAGMKAENAVFVSTPYPFKDAVTYQLKKLGLDVRVPKQTIKSYEEEVDKGIQKMLATYEAEAKRNGHSRPILILDDGGLAAKIIAKKYKEHFTKFRIVEITAAGERIAKNLTKEYGRLPFVYFSIAYSQLKKKITSRFFGNRVADKLIKLVPQTGVPLKNNKVAVRGAGPMGLYAALRLRDEHKMDVVLVDPDPEVAREAEAHGFKVLPPEKAYPGRSIILGMSGYTMDTAELKHLDDDAFVVQGSSKRQEFPMEHVEKITTSKVELPRSDGLPQKSFTYTIKDRGWAKAKRLHFLGDGWTLNHDGSLHGTPIEDIQLELAMVFESAVEAVDTHLTDTGRFGVVGKNIQKVYIDAWRQMKKRLGQDVPDDEAAL